ncbi:MAG: type II toxin-antitoxin system VapC family toxin [Acidobacteria bacterium]|nr:type II toxin-antitoxin system VapC family toxin [Acidobacteriota bacterium]
MAGIFFDTTVYIRAFRTGDPGIFSERSIARFGAGPSVPVWMNAVVSEELYAGASDAKARKLLAKMEKDFEKVKRLIVPLQSDWANAGQLLNKLAKRYGFEHIGRSRLVNDVLIAMTAARTGTMVLTENARDFSRIEEFRKFKWKVG